MDAETTADPPAVPPTTEPAPPAAALATTGNRPLSDPPLDPRLPPTPAETRQTALTAFLAAPRLRDPTHTHVSDISILLHLLRDTLECLISLSRITPCIPGTEADRGDMGSLGHPPRARKDPRPTRILGTGLLRDSSGQLPIQCGRTRRGGEPPPPLRHRHHNGVRPPGSHHWSPRG